jgi:dienelactone hydrolase
VESVIDDFTAWLRAQFDEDEQVAMRAANLYPDEPGRESRDWSDGKVVLLVDDGVPDQVVDRLDQHVCRQDPKRTIAEVEAKRLILAEHTCACPNPDCRDCGACSGDHHADPTPAPCRTLRLLALPYAGEPGYREDWRP